MNRLPIYILAGGQSRRFGSDKARALLAGKPLIAHVARAIQPFASRLRVVADTPGKYEDLGFTTLADRVPGLGPLGGLLAALRDCDEPWLLLVPCDFIGLRSAWVDQLLQSPREGLDALVFGGSPRQPMPGLYHTRLADPVEQHLAGGGRSLQSLLDACKVALIPRPADWPAHAGVNTAGELAEHPSADSTAGFPSEPPLSG